MFKIHPKVPECMSDEAKAFIMNCFTPNPDDRATASELLMDAFLRSHPRKKPKAVQEPDPKDFLSIGESSVTFAQIPSRPARTCPGVHLTPETWAGLFSASSSNLVLLCFVAEYQRSLSVPISIFVEDIDSPSDSIDLSASLDLRWHVSALKTNDISESPPGSSFLPWVHYSAEEETHIISVFAIVWPDLTSMANHTEVSVRLVQLHPVLKPFFPL